MKSVRLFLVLGISIFGLAYLIFSPPRGGHRDRQLSQVAGDLEIGEPVVFGNLAIFPVSSKTPRNDDRFITLDEGLAAGTVEIVEAGAAAANGATGNQDPFAATSDNSTPRVLVAAPQADPFADAPAPSQPAADQTGNQPVLTPPAEIASHSELPNESARTVAVGVNSVNQLMVINRSDKPLYLMPGEIVIGGSQDRVVGQELVVAPDRQAVPLDVFCVEHGRWGGRTAAAYVEIFDAAASNATAGEGESIAGFSANLSLNVAQSADIANAGKFIASVGNLNAASRLAVQRDKDQSKVWDEVAKQNMKSEVHPTTGTFTSNYATSESIERLTPFIDELLKPIAETKNVVGVIVAVNGGVTAMDVFESTPLFRKLWPKLLKSYALDATSAAGNEASTKVATRSHALEFLQEVAKAKSGQVENRGSVAVDQRESDKVLMFSAHQRRAAEPGETQLGAHGGVGLGGMTGDLNDAIHASGFSK